MSDSSSFSSQEGSSIRVRSYDPADEAFVLGLAPRLVIGIPAWRDADRMLAIVQRWLTKSIEQHGTKTMLSQFSGRGCEAGEAAVISFRLPSKREK